MQIVPIGPASVRKIAVPRYASHKGDNGRVLIFAGSQEHFGALWFAGTAASRFSDWAYVATSEKNIPIAKSTNPCFTVIPFSQGLRQIHKTDAILAGPGLEKNQKTKTLLQKIIRSRPKKMPLILDATALRVLKPEDLDAQCLVTPHSDEFSSFFDEKPVPHSLSKLAKRFKGIIVLKGAIDYVADSRDIFSNRTGNPGMTKGGTGDVLAGLIAAFSTKNDLLSSAKAAVFLNGYAADRLYQSMNTMYNAMDLLDAIPLAYQKIRSKPFRQGLK